MRKKDREKREKKRGQNSTPQSLKESNNEHIYLVLLYSAIAKHKLVKVPSSLTRTDSNPRGFDSNEEWRKRTSKEEKGGGEIE